MVTVTQGGCPQRALQSWTATCKLIVAHCLISVSGMVMQRNLWACRETPGRAGSTLSAILSIVLQVPIVAAEAQAALAAGQAVVIGLQSTGEAAADAMQLEPGQTCGYVSTTRELLTRFVAQHFPVRYEPGPNEPAGKNPPACCKLSVTGQLFFPTQYAFSAWRL